MFRTALLSPKGLLSAMVAAFVSGHALADVAGRVNFVSGEVSAVASDGSRRSLAKGDLVNSGERLETGKGRLQIRFTDGSFLSLQPNTVFGLESYSYAKDKPEQGSLLFNFVRGGMRTVSGAIGKINRANYKVKTPVATIGIRGTGYAGTMSNGVLVVSVNKGIVNLTNDFGSSNVSAGQTFQTQDGKAPEPAPSGVSAQARADNPDNTTQEDKKEERQTERQENIGNNIAKDDSSTNPNLIAGVDNPLTEDDVTDPVDPTPLSPLFPNSQISLDVGQGTISPFYAMATPKIREATDTLSTGQVGVQFKDTTGTDRNAVTKIEEINASNPDSLATTTTIFDIGTLKAVNIQTKGGLTFGEWTNGTGKFEGANFSLTSNQFLPYIVGLQANTNNENTRVVFQLDGASAARNGSNAGTLDRFNLAVNYAQGLIDIDLQVSINNNVYVVNETGIHRFNIDSVGGADISNLLAKNTTDCQQGCATSIGFMFAGVGDGKGNVFSSQVGAAYQILLANQTSIEGVGALLLNPSQTSTPTVRDSVNQISSNNDAVFAASFVGNNDALLLRQETAISGKFDPTTGELLTATTADGASYGRVDDPNSVITANAGSYKKVLAWGQWTAKTPTGSSNLVSFNGAATNIGNLGLDVHYIIGTPTTDMANTRGVVTYNMVGGSTPQGLINGANDSLTQTGFVIVNFSGSGGLGTASLLASVTGFDNNSAGLAELNFTGQTDLTGTSQLNFNQLSVTAATGNGSGLVCTGCSGSASGIFAGNLVTINTATVVPTAIGLGYQLTGTANNVNAGTATNFDVSGAMGLGNPVVNLPSL
ncbi:FecR domain-containing protein [Agitococcus lubricus]|uniref:FecR family protein n=1 Tax=Agitococcus lubricus TaxID=1077255 RepID=A0A2T5IY46_9GAMM|nr:FecR domain-containing protein [Agitococcus lubricus]PTQ88882.1 FecR family protein [Agitococcus lubricus]